MESNLKWEKLRKRAEKILGERSSLAGDWPEPDEILRLIHELEVHQVELEIQDEELRLKNEELKELVHRYTELYQQAPVSFVNLNCNGMIINVNQAASDMLETARGKLHNLAFSRFVHAKDRPKYFELLTELNRAPGRKARGEMQLLKESDRPFHAHVEIGSSKNGQGAVQGWLVAFMDISKRKEAEKALQEAYSRIDESRGHLKNLSARLLSVQEEERRRIARELHDSFGQSLAAIKFSIENALSNGVPADTETVSILLKGLIPNIQEVMEDIRKICTGLRPSVLDDFGIVAAIGWFCREFFKDFPNLKVETEIDVEEEDIPEELKIVLFRIAQEALNNVVKHSRAEWARLSLTKVEDEIELVIEDNGVGFDQTAIAQGSGHRGIGLASMKERAELSSGSLEIESSTGTGTRITARWRL